MMSDHTKLCALKGIIEEYFETRKKLLDQKLKSDSIAESYMLNIEYFLKGETNDREEN